MRMTNRALQIWFRKLNRDYFKNTLDPDIRVSFKSIRVLGRTKRVWFQRPATTKERRENGLNKTAIACYYIPRIWIAEKIRFSPRLAITTLLHEMVHAENMGISCHGPNWNRFNQRMLDLAKAGAFNGWW